MNKARMFLKKLTTLTQTKHIEWSVTLSEMFVRDDKIVILCQWDYTINGDSFTVFQDKKKSSVKTNYDNDNEVKIGSPEDSNDLRKLLEKNHPFKEEMLTEEHVMDYILDEYDELNKEL